MDILILNVLSTLHGASKGTQQLQYKDCLTISVKRILQLDQQYVLGAKTISHEDLIHTEVEMGARKSVNRWEFG